MHSESGSGSGPEPPRIYDLSPDRRKLYKQSKLELQAILETHDIPTLARKATLAYFNQGWQQLLHKTQRFQFMLACVLLGSRSTNWIFLPRSLVTYIDAFVQEKPYFRGSTASEFIVKTLENFFKN